MFSCVALSLDRLPAELIERHGLHNLIRERDGQRELQFLLAAGERILPVWLDGQLQLVRWGNQRAQSRHLPITAWTSLESLEAGDWGDRVIDETIIPASAGLDGGVWFGVTEGVRAVVVRDEQERPVVYVLVEPATHSYQAMTLCQWMPMLVGQKI